MPRGEKLFRFLVDLMLAKFYGTVRIRFEGGKETCPDDTVRNVSTPCMKVRGDTAVAT
jgi:hypothetical protein